MYTGGGCRKWRARSLEAVNESSIRPKSKLCHDVLERHEFADVDCRWVFSVSWRIGGGVKIDEVRGALVHGHVRQKTLAECRLARAGRTGNQECVAHRVA